MENKSLYLLFVNEMGPNYKGNYIYEFVFGQNKEDADGEDWDLCTKGTAPDTNFIDKVGIVEETEIKFDVIQNNDFLTVNDAKDNIIALAWENFDEYEDDDLIPEKRLVFHFGEMENIVVDKLYERDIILKFKE